MNFRLILKPIEARGGPVSTVSSPSIALARSPRSSSCCLLRQGFYKNGRFVFSFAVGRNYPHEPPKVHCDTKVRAPAPAHNCTRAPLAPGGRGSPIRGTCSAGVRRCITPTSTWKALCA
jgi:hypothetical protein